MAAKKVDSAGLGQIADLVEGACTKMGWNFSMLDPVKHVKFHLTNGKTLAFDYRNEIGKAQIAFIQITNPADARETVSLQPAWKTQH